MTSWPYFAYYASDQFEAENRPHLKLNFNGGHLLVHIDPMHNKSDTATLSFFTYMGRNCGAAFISRDKNKDG